MRAWNADAVLRNIYERYVTSRQTIVNVIENSHIFKAKFQEYVERSQHSFGIHVKNLSLAKHRFDSTQKPVGRMVLFMDALVSVALYILAKRARTSREGKIAEDFLRGLNMEDYIQLAMMADAGDETIMLVRLCDSEDFDPATSTHEIAEFKKRISYLFRCGGCLRTEGYTLFAIQACRRVRNFIVGKEILSFGDRAGVGEDVTRRCLERMQVWVSLALATLEAEFPHFELLQSFSVFSLAGAQCGRCENWAAHVQRLAMTFKVDESTLRVQLEDLWPIARGIASDNGISQQEAWRTLFQRLAKDHRARQRHPTSALKPLLTRWFTFTASTSAVEQNFAKMLHISRAAQSGASVQVESDTAKVLLDYNAAYEDKTIALARLTWARFFGPPRTHKRHRLDKGVPRAKKDFDKTATNNTEVAFVRDRRQRVAHAAAEASKAEDLLRVASPPIRLSGSVRKELEFQASKAQKRKVESLQEGSLLASEITHDLVDAGRMKAQVAAERARQREAATRRATAKDITQNTIQAATLKGQHIWIEPALKTDDLLRAAARHQMKDTDSRLEALTSLNHTPTHTHCVVIPQRSLWHLPSVFHTLFPTLLVRLGSSSWQTRRTLGPEWRQQLR